MQIRLAAELQKDSIVDGEGLRAVLWTQGCSHNCPGCHNPSTHDFNGGALIDLEEVYSWIDELEGHDGITLSGGDPMYQSEACLYIAKYAKKKGLNIWCYTGFTFEELLDRARNDKSIIELLKNIDVLIDGRFKLEQKSYDIKFRGSKNQRILDSKKSIKEKKPIMIEKYEHEYEEYNPLKRSHIYI